MKILSLPDLPEHGDVSDWLDAGGTVEALRKLIAEAPEYKPADDDTDGAVDDDGDEEREPRESVATTLVNLATDSCELWHDGDKAYATIETHGHRQHALVRSRAFRDWLRGTYYL